jgi:hypothetical protein
LQVESLYYSGFKYRLYKTTVSKLLAAQMVPLSDAVTGSDPVLTVIEEGEKLSPTDLAPDVFYQIYFWDLLFEHGDTPAQNRLWFFRGTEILVTTASSYQSPETGGNAYKLFGPGHEMWDVCGHNVDAADLTNETVRQIRRGVSLKHGAKAMDAGISFGGAGGGAK